MFNTLYELLELQSKQRSNSPAILSEQRPSLTFERLFIQSRNHRRYLTFRWNTAATIVWRSSSPMVRRCSALFLQ